MKSKKKIGKKNQAINDNGLGALQTKQLLTFVYLFLQIQRAFFASFFTIIVSVEWKLRDDDDDDDDVNALRAPVWVLGTGFCVSIGSFGSSNTPRLQPLLLGLLSAPMNERPPARTHSWHFPPPAPAAAAAAWSGMHGQKWKPQNLWANIIKLYRLWVEKHLHNFKVVALVTYGHITIAVRQSTVVWSL